MAGIERAFANLGLGADDVDLVVASDAEQILGIGDWGVGGGAGIAAGKLAVYTAAAGIDPMRAVPVALDVGTDNEALLNDPGYVGYRHARVRGRRYDEFIDAYVRSVTRMFPHAMLHWEDFGPSPSRSSARWPRASNGRSSSRSPTPPSGSRRCRPTCCAGPAAGR